MKRAPELITLSKEHHQSLRLAKRCLDTLAKNDPQAISALCQQIAQNFDADWERHFRNEENSIFCHTQNMQGYIHELGERLLAEHERMRQIAAEFKRGDCRHLREFGTLLRDHTRLEERELFPLIEQQFSAEQLHAIEAHIREPANKVCSTQA